MATMQALVTGGTGFIGSHLVDELIGQGYHVRVLRRRTSNTTGLNGKTIGCVVGDLTDKHSLLPACTNVDVVFHVAALPRDWGPKRLFDEVNVYGTRNLLDACVDCKVPRVVLMSSAAVYGFPNTIQRITEEYPTHPTAKYGESKRQAEDLLWEYGKRHTMMVTAVRSPLVTGPRDTMIAPFLINALTKGRLFYVGQGYQQISISDGRDVASCLRLAGETSAAQGRAYNVKSFDSTPRQLLETLAEALHVPAPTKTRSYTTAYILASVAEGLWMLRGKPDPPLTRHKVKVLGHTRLLDITNAHHELHYTPRYSMQTTINDLVSWYQHESSATTI
ncbi:MAG: NAD-dependent epimerase/dehydratase family protein [Candidatus Thermoplasmatota archaeon]|nr:NAD-dependent epimerase/dehydratase family protein [Candidatus Thermoplasmatota archaeon]